MQNISHFSSFTGNFVQDIQPLYLVNDFGIHSFPYFAINFVW